MSEEKDFYELIKNKLEETLKRKFGQFHLEITANRVFSNKLKAQISPDGKKDIIFNFLTKAAPDITGFVKIEGFLSDKVAFVIVEIKNEEIKIDDIYQTKKYAELFNAECSLLVSTKEIPEEIKRLSKVIPTFLFYGHNTPDSWDEISYKEITLVHFDALNHDFAKWYKKNPFKE